jgi:hypothetical protein
MARMAGYNIQVGDDCELSIGPQAFILGPVHRILGKLASTA